MPTVTIYPNCVQCCGGIRTDCCPEDALPRTLYLFLVGGGCGVTNPIVLTYTDVALPTHTWQNDGTGHRVTCSGGQWTLDGFGACVATITGVNPDSATCSPFCIVFPTADCICAGPWQLSLSPDGCPEALRAAPGEMEGPSLLKKAFNLAIASAEHLAAGMPVTPDAEIERRANICRSCVGPGGYYNPEKGTCNHNKCGCFMSVKQAWAEQRCPIGKW